LKSATNGLFHQLCTILPQASSNKKESPMKNAGYYGLLLLYLTNGPGLIAQDKDLFREYEQIIERGDIPAIFNPTYVTAQKALIDDNTWILGVVINDQARAYSLNLLNHHEVVNDNIDTTSFAAVW